MTELFLGPRVAGTVGRWVGEASFDLPVLMNTTQFQTTPIWQSGLWDFSRSNMEVNCKFMDLTAS
jgi:hypothetical protein